MIDYDLIVPSASRPHLLERVLDSLLSHVDQKPRRLIVHDDAAFKDRQHLVHEVATRAAGEHGVSLVYGQDDPPLNHGPSIHWLLERVNTQYALYTQDDHIVMRNLPIKAALDVMHQNDLHHIRFNKRATMEYKGEFRKHEVVFPRTLVQMPYEVEIPDVGTIRQATISEDITLCISDHWYFQTSLWRVARIKPVVDWWMQNYGPSFHEHCEVKINRTFNGQEADFNAGFPHFDVPHIGRRQEIDPTNGTRMLGDNPMDPIVRHRYQRTYIWGKIGETQYIDHIGGDPADWALWRPRGGHGGPRDSQSLEGRR